MPRELQNAYYFQISSKGHANKSYSLEAWNETTLYLGIHKNDGRTDEELEKEITAFTTILGKKGSGWTKEPMIVTTDCCKINEIWSMKKTATGLHTITMPIIKTDEFPFVIFVTGMS